jgi:hypothetical protein
MVCQDCNQPLAEGARFCPACGKAVVAAPPAVAAPPMDDARTVLRDPRTLPRTGGETTASPPPARRRGLTLAAGGALIIAIGSAVGFWRVSHPVAPTPTPAPARGGDDAGPYTGSLWNQFEPAEVRDAMRAFDQRIAAEEQTAARRTESL